MNATRMYHNPYDDVPRKRLQNVNNFFLKQNDKTNMNDVQLLPVYNKRKRINGPQLIFNKDPFMYFLLFQLGLYMHRFEKNEVLYDH